MRHEGQRDGSDQYKGKGAKSWRLNRGQREQSWPCAKLDPRLTAPRGKTIRQWPTQRERKEDKATEQGTARTNKAKRITRAKANNPMCATKENETAAASAKGKEKGRGD